MASLTKINSMLSEVLCFDLKFTTNMTVTGLNNSAFIRELQYDPSNGREMDIMFVVHLNYHSANI